MPALHQRVADLIEREDRAGRIIKVRRHETMRVIATKRHVLSNRFARVHIQLLRAEFRLIGQADFIPSFGGIVFDPTGFLSANVYRGNKCEGQYDKGVLHSGFLTANSNFQAAAGQIYDRLRNHSGAQRSRKGKQANAKMRPKLNHDGGATDDSKIRLAACPAVANQS